MYTEKQGLDKQLKKHMFEHNERKEFLERQVSKLTEEVSFLKGSVTQARLDGVSGENLSADTAMKESLLILEKKFKEVKDKYNAKSKQYDELDFDHNQVKGTVNGLKAEISRLTESSLEDRKDKHRYEVQLIEARNKYNEVSLLLKQRDERLAANDEQLSNLHTELERVQEILKLEKRKLVALERESEQYIFTTKTKEKEQTELIQSLSKQVSTLKTENDSILARMENMAADGSSKLSRETRENQQLLQKLKLSESREADLAMHLEDLAKKTQFYREQFKRGQGKEKMEALKEKLRSVLLSVKQLKERHTAEVFQSKQDYNALCSLLLRMSEDYLFRVKTRSLTKATLQASSSVNKPTREPFQEVVRLTAKHPELSHLEEIFRKSMENITRGIPKNSDLLQKSPSEKPQQFAKQTAQVPQLSSLSNQNSAIFSTPKPNTVASKENIRPSNQPAVRLADKQYDYEHQAKQSQPTAATVTEKTASKQYLQPHLAFAGHEEHFSLGGYPLIRDRNSFNGLQSSEGAKALLSSRDGFSKQGESAAVVSLSVAPTPTKNKIEASSLSAKSQPRENSFGISALPKFEGFPRQESKLMNLANSIFPLKSSVALSGQDYLMSQSERVNFPSSGFGSLGIPAISKPAGAEKKTLQQSPPFGYSGHNSLHMGTAGFAQVLGGSPSGFKPESRALGSDLRRIEEESEEIARRIQALRSKDQKPVRHLDYED